MVQWLLFIFVLANPSSLWALESKEPVLSLDDPYSIEWALMDNPVFLRTWAKTQIDAVDAENDPTHWIKAVATFMKAKDPSDFSMQNRRYLDKALQLLTNNPVPNAFIFALRSTQLEFQVADEYGPGAVVPPARTDTLFDNKLKLAEELKLPGKKALMNLLHGQFMIESDRVSQAIKKIHKVMKDLNATKDVSDLELMQAKINYATELDTVGSKEKARQIYEEIENFCSRNNLRSFCLSVDHDFGFSYLNDNNNKDHTNPANNRDNKENLEGIRLVKRALEKAEALSDDNMVGSICNSLIAAFDLIGDYPAAKSHALRAIEIFGQQNNGVYLADSQIKLASVLIHTNEAEEALKYLATASKSFPREFYMDQRLIAHLRSKAYKMLNQPEKAFESLNYLARAHQENARRNQNTEIVQYLTQINLELEEEQSRSLTEAENLQKIQDELNTIKVKEQQSTLLMINVIWITSALLIASGVFGLIWIRHQNRKIIRLNRHLREDILQRFLPPVIAEKVATGESVLDEIPHEQQITALFGRLVGLENAIEDLGPRVTARLLESLMQSVTDLSLEYQGCLDKLHRGSFLILFGAPINSPVDEQIAHAVAFAHSIMDSFSKIRDSWPTVEGWRPGLAIGIHQGSALVGVFGGKRRADYTAIGQTVNLAARIEGEAKSGEIMVSENVAHVLQDRECRSLGDVKLKGISKPQKLFMIERAKVERNAS